MRVHLLLRPLLVSLLTASAGCASSVPRNADMPMPDPEFGMADFSAIFDDSAVSSSVYAMGGGQAPGRDAMARVLLSPNLVFEASRSSANEPATLGPEGAIAPAPDLHDALGKPVSISMSSVLLEYLVRKGSALIVPAVTTSWENTEPCAANAKSCSQTTWVERLMLASVKPQEARGRADAALFPTAAFGVRQLGIESIDLPVVVRRDGDRLVFSPRRSLTEKSACGRLTLSVPVVLFAAEIVTLQDARLLARVHEQRRPEVDVVQQASIDLTEWKPIKRVAYTRVRHQRPLRSSRYAYVENWRRKGVHCSRALEAYDQIQVQVEEAMLMQLPTTVMQILKDSLDRLYPAGGAPLTPGSNPGA